MSLKSDKEPEKTVKRHRSFAIVLGLWVMALLLAACGSSEKSEPRNNTTDQDKTAFPTPTENSSQANNARGEYQTLTIDEFANIVETRADEYLIINTHIPYAGEVKNTDANIPYNDLNALMAAIPSKDTPVILYCRSGNMSQQASRALIEQGYTHVWDAPGGMIAWQESGRDLLDK
jgi:rhodanese-related sulfurtransferase